VVVNQSILLHGSLIDAGVDSTLRLIQGAGHGLPIIEDTYVRQFFLRTLAVPHCAGDWNANSIRNVPDIFAFLAVWFAGDPAADLNASGATDVQDIFEFLSEWFAPC
jgi:hypothetical protein